MQGEPLDELLNHLRDLYADLSSGQVPDMRQVGELVVP